LGWQLFIYFQNRPHLDLLSRPGDITAIYKRGDATPGTGIEWSVYARGAVTLLSISTDLTLLEPDGVTPVEGQRANISKPKWPRRLDNEIYRLHPVIRFEAPNRLTDGRIYYLRWRSVLRTTAGDYEWSGTTPAVYAEVSPDAIRTPLELNLAEPY